MKKKKSAPAFVKKVKESPLPQPSPFKKSQQFGPPKTRREAFEIYFRSLHQSHIFSKEGLMNPYYSMMGFNNWMNNSSPEVCRSNFWWFTMTRLKSNVAIVMDVAGGLETAFSGIPLTHPLELKKLGPAYRQWDWDARLNPTLWEQHTSALSRAVHLAIKKSGTKAMLFNLCPYVPFFPGVTAAHDLVHAEDIREIDFKENHLTARETIKFLQAITGMGVKLIVINKRGKKLIAKSGLKATFVPFKRGTEWPKTLAKTITKLA